MTGRSATCPTPRPTAAGRRPAGCCSAACWPASTRSTSSCPARSGCTCAATAPYGPPRLRPEPAVAAHEQVSVDRQAAGAALETVGRIGELLTLLEEEPAGLLRSGGVGVRDQKRLARVLHVGEPEAGLAAGARVRGRAARRRRAAPRRVAADPRLRHLARAGPRRPLGDAGRRLAGRRPAAVAGRPARRRRQGGQPAVARPGPAHRPGDPPLGADRARRVPARRRAGRPTTWSRCCAGAPRGGPTGWRPCPRCSPRPPGSACSSAGCCRRPAAGCCPRARTARPTACAGCCPSRSTTCSPSPTSR